MELTSPPLLESFTRAKVGNWYKKKDGILLLFEKRKKFPFLVGVGGLVRVYFFIYYAFVPPVPSMRGKTRYQKPRFVF